MLSIASQIYEAARSPNNWPVVLQLVAEASNAVGAACLIWNRHTAQVEWMAMSAIYPAHTTSDYFRHYAAIDPYLPLLTANPCGNWLRLSQCIAPEILRRNEWYCDFVVRNGVADSTANRLIEVGNRTFILGLHSGIGQRPIEPDRAAALQRLLTPLTQAAGLTIELRQLRCVSLATALATEHLGAAIILCDSAGRVIEVNNRAETLLRSGDILMVKDGRLTARRAFEDSRLETLIAAATGLHGPAVGGRMLLGNGLRAIPWVASVMPIDAERSSSGHGVAMLLISGTASNTGVEEQIGELFGLSAAEARLAAALAQGRTIGELAADSGGAKIATLRTQLSATLRKLGVRRQADLTRLLASLPPSRSRSEKI
jgi:PAS domain-containing protein/DNA-binding CsgD family transcriptional regulator